MAFWDGWFTPWGQNHPQQQQRPAPQPQPQPHPAPSASGHPPAPPASGGHQPKTSGWEAFGRGLLNTVTLGHGDQVLAWAANTIQHPSQIFNAPSRAQVDAQHQRTALARREHPGWSATGEVVGVVVDVVAAVALPGPALLWLAGATVITGGWDWYANGRHGGFMGLLGSIWDAGWNTVSGAAMDFYHWANGTPIGPVMGVPTTVAPGDPDRGDRGPGDRRPGDRGPAPPPAFDTTPITVPANATEQQIQTASVRALDRLRTAQAGQEVHIKIGDHEEFVLVARGGGVYNMKYMVDGRQVDGTINCQIDGDPSSRWSLALEIQRERTAYAGGAYNPPSTNISTLPDGRIVRTGPGGPLGVESLPAQQVNGYDIGSATLSPAQKAELDRLAAQYRDQLARDPNARIRITVTGGHDHLEFRRGDSGLENAGLATQRGQGGAAYLQQKMRELGVDMSRVDIVASESETPAVPYGTNAQGEPENRRIQVDAEVTSPPPQSVVETPVEPRLPAREDTTRYVFIPTGGRWEDRPPLRGYEVRSYDPQIGQNNMWRGEYRGRNYRGSFNFGVNSERWNSRRFSGTYYRYDAPF